MLGFERVESASPVVGQILKEPRDGLEEFGNNMRESARDQGGFCDDYEQMKTDQGDRSLFLEQRLAVVI